MRLSLQAQFSSLIKASIASPFYAPGLTIDDAIEAEQAITLVEEPCKAAAADHAGEERKCIDECYCSTFDGFIGVGEANDGGIK